MLEELKAIAKELLPSNKIDWSKVDENTDLVSDLGFDSITFIMMSIKINQEYDVTIKQEDIEKIKTVGDVISFIENN